MGLACLRWNIRFTMEDANLRPELLREIGIIAARDGTSISALTIKLLEERVEHDRQYEQAKHRAMADMRKALHFGGRPLSREEIYKR